MKKVFACILACLVTEYYIKYGLVYSHQLRCLIRWFNRHCLNLFEIDPQDYDDYEVAVFLMFFCFFLIFLRVLLRCLSDTKLLDFQAVIIYLSVRGVHDSVYDTRLQVQKHCSWNVVIIVSLVEEHILSIRTGRCELLQNALRRYPVLNAELLPELETNYEKQII